jgi:hypothetical protein
MPYGDAVLELSVNLNAEQVLQECERRGLVVRSERELGSGRGGRHWHLHLPGRPGTLEMNDCRGQVSLKVHPRRDGGWASTLAAEIHAMPDPNGAPSSAT